MSLLAKSLGDFAPAAWHVIADTLVDRGASAPLSDLTAAVRAYITPGDLRRAEAWLGDDRDDLDEGARLLTEKIVDELAERGVVERDGETVAFTESYWNAHALPDGGVRLVLAGQGWRTYDALPADVRQSRHDLDASRENMNAAITQASRYRREVKTPEQRSSPRQKTVRESAEELLESLRSFGYLPAFPIAINKHGHVVEGNHRLEYAEIARKSLLVDRERVAANGCDPLVLADLDRRIKSLERDEILRHARPVDGSPADEVRVTVAAQVHIPWESWERARLANQLTLDGYSVAAIADMLGASERSVERWTEETRDANKEIEQAAQLAEAERLRDLGWSYERVAKQIGVARQTVLNWIGTSNSRQVADTGRATPEPPKPSEPVVSDEVLEVEADAWVANSDGGMRKFEAHIRATHGAVGTHRAQDAVREARDRAEAERQRVALLGEPEPEPEPEWQPCSACDGTGKVPA